MAKKIALTLEHIKEIMEKDIVIGSDNGKKFVFNPQKNEYVVYARGTYVAGGQDLEALLEIYNDI